MSKQTHMYRDMNYQLKAPSHKAACKYQNCVCTPARKKQFQQCKIVKEQN